MTNVGPLDWGVFVLLVAALLLVDLRTGARAASSTRRAVVWSAIWIGLAFLFGLFVLVRFGADSASAYYAAWLLEKSLSVDNLFAFSLVFGELAIPRRLQHRLLFLGVLGALVGRAVMLALGIQLIEHLSVVVYVFAGLLLLAALRLLFGQKVEERAIKESCAVCSTWIARYVPVTGRMSGGRFLLREEGKLKATPLLVALIVIETADLIFALDSIPAVLAISNDPFIVYTSNVFAMLGLRSLYFVIAGVIDKLVYLRPGLALILVFVAAKLIFADHLHIGPLASLLVIATIMGIAIVASLLRGQSAPQREKRAR